MTSALCLCVCVSSRAVGKKQKLNSSRTIVYNYYLFIVCAVKPVVPRCSVPVAVTVGTSSELRCLENEGFPASQYRWFRNNEELPQDPKSSPKFINSTYSINADTGGLVRN